MAYPNTIEQLQKSVDVHGQHDVNLSVLRNALDNDSDMRGVIKAVGTFFLQIRRTLVGDANLATTVTASSIPGLPFIIIGMGVLFATISATINSRLEYKNLDRRKKKLERILELQNKISEIDRRISRPALSEKEYLMHVVNKYLYLANKHVDKKRKLYRLVAEVLGLDYYDKDFITKARRALNSMTYNNVSNWGDRLFGVTEFLPPVIRKKQPWLTSWFYSIKAWLEDRTYIVKTLFTFTSFTCTGIMVVIGAATFFAWGLTPVVIGAALVVGLTYGTIFAVHCYRQDRKVHAAEGTIDQELTAAEREYAMAKFDDKLEKLKTKSFKKNHYNSDVKRDSDLEAEKQHVTLKHLNRFTGAFVVLLGVVIGMGVVYTACTVLTAPISIPAVFVVGAVWGVYCGMKFAYGIKEQEVAELQSRIAVNNKEAYLRENLSYVNLNEFLKVDGCDLTLKAAKAKVVMRVIDDYTSRYLVSLERGEKAIKCKKLLRLLVSATQMQDQSLEAYSDAFFNKLLGYLNEHNPEQAELNRELVKTLKVAVYPDSTSPVIEDKDYTDRKTAERASSIYTKVIMGANAVSAGLWIVMMGFGFLISGVVAAPLYLTLFAIILTLSLTAYGVKLYVDYKKEQYSEARENRSAILDIAEFDNKLQKNYVLPEKICSEANEAIDDASYRGNMQPFFGPKAVNHTMWSNVVSNVGSTGHTNLLTFQGDCAARSECTNGDHIGSYDSPSLVRQPV